MLDEKRFPYMKWYARDWRGDGALRGCSFAARGLWADIITVIHDEGSPYGFLRINGVDPDSGKLGRMLGASSREIDRLLGELEEAGVFSRSSEGTIYSRRMVRDKAKADADKENGKAGGNPKLKTANNGWVNPPDKAQSPEPLPRSKEETLPVGTGCAPVKAKGSREDYSEDFQRFWTSYPRNRNMEKKPAFQQWKKLSPEKRAAAIAALPAFRQFCEQNSWYHPVYPERFLSKEKFESYLADAVPELTPDQIAENKDRADKLMGRGKYGPQMQ